MELSDKQKELLIDLIDGYFYPRDLINDYEKFLVMIAVIQKIAQKKNFKFIKHLEEKLNGTN